MGSARRGSIPDRLIPGRPWRADSALEGRFGGPQPLQREGFRAWPPAANGKRRRGRLWAGLPPAGGGKLKRRWEIRLVPRPWRLLPFAFVPVAVLYGLFSDRFHAEGWDALFGSDAPFTLLFTVAAFSAVTMEIVKTLALRRLYLVNAALSLLLLAVVRWLWSFSS